MWIFITLWLIIGLISTVAQYYTSIKMWYMEFKEDYRKYNNGHNSLSLLKFCSPLLILSGPLNLLMLFGTNEYEHICLYFKIPKDV